MLLPVYGVSFNQLNAYFHLDSITITKQRGQRFVTVEAITQGARVIDGRKVPDGITVSASTLAGHGMQPFIILFCAIPLWPAKTRSEYLVIALASLFMFIMIQAIDTPLVLSGALEDMVLYSFTQDQLTSSPLVQGMHFMNSGGRLALSLMGVGLVRVIQLCLCRDCRDGVSR